MGKIQKVQKLFENFRKHTIEEGVPGRSVLQEIGREHIDNLLDWYEDNPENLSFSDLFDGELRVSFPVGKGQVEGEIGKLIYFFEHNGWDVNLGSGTASKTMPYTIPAGPRQGEVIQKTQKQRIGKLLENFVKYEENKRRMNKLGRGSGSEYFDLEDRQYTLNKELRKAFPSLSEWEMYGREVLFDGHGYRWAQLWNSKSEYFRKNPDIIKQRAVPEFTVVASRHPIDVLRMSDYRNIESCHTEGHEYFHCAIGEARGHGPIAYLVKTQDLQGVDLDEQEIFEDPSRGIRGIRPVGRVRLRKYVNSDDGYELAAPETRTYGTRHPGFLEAVLSWAQEEQKVNIEKARNVGDIYEFTRYGGSYGDNRDGGLLNKLLGREKFTSYKDTHHEMDPAEEEAEDTGEALAEQYDEECYSVQRSFDDRSTRTWVSYDVENEGFGEVYVYYRGGLRFDHEFCRELESRLLKVPKAPNGYRQFEDYRQKREFGQVVEDAIQEHTNMVGDDWADVYFGMDIMNIEQSLEPDGFDHDPDGFDSFAEAVLEVDSYYEEIQESLLMMLIEDGWVQDESADPSQLNELGAWVVEDDPKLTNQIRLKPKVGPTLMQFKSIPEIERLQKVFLIEFIDFVGELFDDVTDEAGISDVPDWEVERSRFGFQLDGNDMKLQCAFLFDIPDVRSRREVIQFILSLDDNYNNFVKASTNAFKAAAQEVNQLKLFESRNWGDSKRLMSRWRRYVKG